MRPTSVVSPGVRPQGSGLLSSAVCNFATLNAIMGTQRSPPNARRLPLPFVISSRFLMKSLLARFALATVVANGIVTAGVASAAGPISFNRDIRPLLSNRCFACHGPDEAAREAGLRLDVSEEAIEFGVIEPGDADASELVLRIESDDPYHVMPPSEHGEPLKEEERALIRQWIEEGAEFQTHWSFVPPLRTSPPAVDESWGGEIRNPIDQFVLRGIRQAGFSPSPPADPRTLVRRLSFDLTGLPPDPGTVDAFVADPSRPAYERLVEDLLQSPHHGERLAMYWLDLVRYADTLGFHGDQVRSVSPYRDYVIGAFQANKPFDEFTVEQIAGDLLPEATLEQKVASTYNRLNRASGEGGVQPKEYLARYAADRVRTTGAVWLGTTFGCAECHDHKFDPFTIKDFYQFAAFFADIKEQGIVSSAVHIEQLPVPTEAQKSRQAKLKQAVAEAEQAYQADTPEIDAAFAQWLAATEATLAQADKEEADKEEADESESSDEESGEGSELDSEVAEIVRKPAEARTEAEIAKLDAAFREQSDLLAEARARLTKRREELAALESSIVTTLATTATEPREMRVLPRGNWMDDSGEIVEPAVPHFLPPVQQEDEAAGGDSTRLDRLDLARWLTSQDNPLVARTFVNRLWMLFFGEGLCRSVDDLGSQGEPPTHPELLDWLASEFVDSGWDVRHLVRLIVTSNTYRQSSLASADPASTSAGGPSLAQQHAADPANEVLARQGRWRLDAELVRDNALAVSGLLVRELGGPSVKPYQPAGYWAQLNFPKRSYQHDTGAQQYRRGLYTHWQRTFLHPSLVAFDAPAREECTARRTRSNTPLQALVLLNDPSFVEAARVLAERVVREGDASFNARLAFAFREALSREPRDGEMVVLQTLLDRQRAAYEDDPEAAERLLATGQAPTPSDLDGAELASWTAVTRAILNLHETITRY